MSSKEDAVREAAAGWDAKAEHAIHARELVVEHALNVVTVVGEGGTLIRWRDAGHRPARESSANPEGFR